MRSKFVVVVLVLAGVLVVGVARAVPGGAPAAANPTPPLDVGTHDPTQRLNPQEQHILDMEATTLAPGGNGYNAYDASGVSSLYTGSGRLVLHYPPRASTSALFQHDKQALEAYVKKARSELQAQILIGGGHLATDPETHRPAVFRASGAKEFVISDDTWK